MNEKETGGPAFPIEDILPEHKGMTLRDYFAAFAMQGAIACCPNGKLLDIPGIAAGSYDMADAMLKARKQ